MNDNMLKKLETATNEALKEEWVQWIGQPPPKSTSRDHFIRVIAWHRQAKDQDGLSGGLKRRLRQLAEDLESGKAQRLLNPPPKVKLGTMIIKTWQGVEYRTMVLEDDFAYCTPGSVFLKLRRDVRCELEGRTLRERSVLFPGQLEQGHSNSQHVRSKQTVPIHWLTKIDVGKNDDQMDTLSQFLMWKTEPRTRHRTWFLPM